MLKQSPNDFNQYHAITLDNGLRVLLIHNEHAKKSAAALAVNAGHFNDPKSRQGLAHFVEHLLFLGTKKYPDGSEYQKFINQHGGQNNAWTATEHTCFFFDIQTAYFEEALDRFSQFFISPLLNKEQINDERKNVDAEFKLKLKDDIRRLYDVHKETINPEHPFSQFSVGNSQTLQDKADVSIQSEAVDFFKLHYHAQNMTLCVEGPQSIELLEKLVVDYFADLKESDSQFHFRNTPLYLNENQAIKINVEPIKNERQLIVNFAMESIDKYYLNKPETILSYLIGHEGAGSILSYLKKQQWAMALTAGSGINGYNFKDFNINITLTELGEEHITDIITAIFSYINLLKSKPIPDFYYQEKAAMSKLAFTYQEKLKPLDHVSQLVINMQHYPCEDYIYGDYAMLGHNPKHFNKLLSYFTPQNMRIIHVSQHNAFDKVSRWYQAPYSVEHINKKLINDWQNPPYAKQLSLPIKNPYISDNIKVYADESINAPCAVNDTAKNIPKKVVEEDGLNIWYKQDNTFKVPKGYVYLGIDCKRAIQSIDNISMTKLFAELYSDTIIEENYDAELAGINYYFYAHQGGFTLQLSGLSEMQPTLLQQLIDSLQTHRVSQPRFELLKRQLITRLENSQQSKAIPKFFSSLSTLLQPNNPSSLSMSKALKDITYEQYMAFCKKLFEEVYLDVLIHGNWLKKHCDIMTNVIRSAFKGKYKDQNLVRCPVVDMKGKGRLLRSIELDKNDHAGVIYLPLENKDTKSIAIAMMTSHLLSPLFFQKMRTEKQYGYLVGIGYVPINRYPGIALYIQSPHTESEQLVEAMDLFVIDCLNELSEIPSDAWLQIKNGLAGQLEEKDQSLRIKSQRFWGAICNKDQNFRHKKQLIEEISSIKVEDIINFVKQFIYKNTKDNNSMSVSPVDSIVIMSSHSENDEGKDKDENYMHQIAGKIHANVITEDLAQSLKGSLKY